jgi:hypothetical protein
MHFLISFNSLQQEDSNLATEGQSPNDSSTDNNPLSDEDEDLELDPEIEAWLEEWQKQREYTQPILDYVAQNRNIEIPERVRTSIEKYFFI